MWCHFEVLSKQNNYGLQFCVRDMEIHLIHQGPRISTICSVSLACVTYLYRYLYIYLYAYYLHYIHIINILYALYIYIYIYMHTVHHSRLHLIEVLTSLLALMIIRFSNVLSVSRNRLQQNISPPVLKSCSRRAEVADECCLTTCRSC